MLSPRLIVSYLLAVELAAGAAPQVKLGKTTLVGRDVTGLKQDFFGAIPFAEPPIGKLRLKPPVFKPNLDRDVKGGQFDASNFGKACLQPGSDASIMSEDCLTINVFRPSGLSKNDRLPVMFWTYGGGFASGVSSLYNGSFIVAESVARGTPVIYVNFNYRLGPLGFPQGFEADKKGALNLAMKDQLTALRWVHENIATFGGDKSKVTVFGESAGAVMTGTLFLNSDLQKYARAAILESGSAGTAAAFNAERRQAGWENFVNSVPGCQAVAKSHNTFPCLLKATANDLFQGFNQSQTTKLEMFPWDPTVDGPGGLLPDLPSRLWAKGHFARIPFITGTNLDEGTLFIPQNIDLSSDVIRNEIIANFSPPVPGISTAQIGHAADRLLELYPDIPALGSPFNTGNQTFGISPTFKRLSAMYGDLAFTSPRRSWIQAATKFGVKAFGYLFVDPLGTQPPPLGISHASELVFVYGAVNAPIAKIMMNYWISFATSLTPNDGKGVARPNWQQYTPKNQAVIQLNGTQSVMIPDTFRAKQMSFINSMPAVFHQRSLSEDV